MKKQILHIIAVLLALAAVLGGAWTIAALADEVPAASVAYYSLSHEEGKYYIQYAVKYEGFDVTGANTGMLFWTENPGRNPEKGSEDAVKPNLGFTEIDGGTYYVFKYDDLEIKQLCDVIYARAYALIDGKYYYSDVAKYSVVTYAARKLGLVEGVAGTTDEALKELLRTMLDYGEKAQKQFGYRLDTLPTDILPENRFSVTFDAAGGSPAPEEQTVCRGRLVTEPDIPKKDGYVFAGWVSDGKVWNFREDTVSADLALTAQWEESDKHTHAWGTEWVTDSYGHWHECICGETKDGEEHRYGGETVTVAPTCALSGKATVTCGCGATAEKILPATGRHVYENGVCTGCGKQENVCNHEDLHEVRVGLGNHGEHGESYLIYRSCECGNVKLLDMERSTYLCHMEQISGEERTTESGGRLYVYESKCSICNIRIAGRTAVEQTDKCHSVLNADFTVTIPDAEPLTLRATETQTYHMKMKTVRVKLADYGACGGTLERQCCAECGEFEDFYLPDMACRFGDSELDSTYVDETGRTHIVTRQVCRDCGLTALEDEGERIISGCETIRFYRVTLRIGKTVIAEMVAEHPDSDHEWEKTAKLLGESCEDGVLNEESCKKCGNYSTYISHDHNSQQKTIPGTDIGLCGGSIVEDRCQRCNTVTNVTFNDYPCIWTFDEEDAEGYDVYHCQICKTVKKVFYLESEKDANCRYTVTESTVYLRDNSEVYRYGRSYQRADHDYEETYELLGDTCEDGYLIHRTCKTCGYASDPSFRFDHDAAEVINNVTTACGKFTVSVTTCKVCKTVLGYYSDIPCKGENRIETRADRVIDGVSHWIHIVSCSNCGLKEQHETWSAPGEEQCTVIEYMRTTWFNGESVISEITQTSVHEDHHYVYTVEFDDPKLGCEGGYLLSWECSVCLDGGETYREPGSGHFGKLEEIDLLGKGACGGSVKVIRCAACGETLMMVDDFDACDLKETTKTETVDGVEHTYVISACEKCGLRVETDSWTAVVSVCLSNAYSKITVTLKGETLAEFTVTEEIDTHSWGDTEYVFQDEVRKCAGGYEVIRHCENCTETKVVDRGYSHRFRRKDIKGTDHGACEGSGFCNICEICGTVDHCNYSADACKLGEQTTVETTDENGWKHTVITSVCETCGMTIIRDCWYQPDNDCEGHQKERVTYRFPDGVEYSTIIVDYYTNDHDFVYTYVYNDAAKGCAGGYTQTGKCSRCGETTQTTQEWGHNMLGFTFDLAEHGGCAGGAVKGQRCIVCNQVVTVWSLSGNVKCTFPSDVTTKQTTDEAGNVHSIWDATCTVCGLRFVTETWTVEGENCVFTSYERVQVIRDGTAVFDETVSRSNPRHQYGKGTVTFDDPERGCEGGFTITRICAKCGGKDELHDKGHQEQTKDTELKNYGLCGGSIQITSCTICKQVLSWSKDDNACKWVYDSRYSDVSAGVSAYSCDVCGTVRKTWQRVEKDEHCYTVRTDVVEYLRDDKPIYSYETPAGARAEHTYLYTLKLDGLTCDDGYTATGVCRDCGDVHTETGKNHKKYLVYYYEGTDCAGAWQHTLGVERCACGDQHNLIRENLDADDNGGYSCATCGLTAKCVTGTKTENCIRTETVLILVTKGEEELFRYEGGISYANHHFGAPEVTFRDGLTDLHSTCVVCGAERYTTASREELVESEDGWYFGLSITVDDVYYTVASDTEGDTYVELYRVDGTDLVLIAYDDNSGGNGNFRLTAFLKKGTQYIFRIRFWDKTRSGAITYSVSSIANPCLHEETACATVLAEGSASCEDGALRFTYCVHCGLLLQKETTTEHELSAGERRDLKQSGSACGGDAVLYRCACGKRQELRMENIGCSWKRTYPTAWADGIMQGSYPTVDGDNYFNSSFTDYTCNDSDCGFVIRVGRYWKNVPGECRAVEHITWRIGYHADTNTWEYEWDILTGDEKECHPYNHTVTETTDYYDCPNCASFYHTDRTLDENGNMTREETTAETVRADGTKCTMKRTMTVYKAPDGFDGDGWETVTEINENGSTTVRKKAEALHDSFPYDIYIYTSTKSGEGAEKWERYDYTYNFETGIRTVRYTNSDGADKTTEGTL